MSKIRVLIADDHNLVRAGLRAILAAEPDIEVVGEASDGVVVVEKCRQLAAEVVLIDLTMPGRSGIETIEDLYRACPEAKLLVVTMHEDEAYARQAFLSGASGYILKRALATELLTAVRTVHRGVRYVAPVLARALVEPKGQADRPQCNATALKLLTPREREVLVLVALGHTSVEIARRLHVTPKTVESHRLHTMAKLGFHGRADLVRFAIEHGLLTGLR